MSRDALTRLHPSIRYLVQQVLRFPALRPVQQLCIDPVLDGRDLVVLAPTAGGKTEAAVLPLFSRMLAERWAPVSALYVCPLRALLNNQHPRLERMARAVGLTVGKWHGDVPAGERRRIVGEPPDLLLITPESLEVLLMGASAERKALLDHVRVAVIDEVHAFAGDARGAHLVSLLSRIERRGGAPIQRVGLSATVGNPEVLAGWLQGPGRDEAPMVVDPPGERTPPEFRFLGIGRSARLAARAIRDLGRGQKRLVFVESRSRAEELGQALRDAGVRVWVHHSSVGRQQREEAEGAFESVRDAALVATSSMELGIDVGDLDHVFQLDAPATVASLAQRLGRTGRRPGSVPRMTFLLESPEKLLLAAALAELFLDGWIEDLEPNPRHWTVLVHQLFANLLETGGCTRGKLVERIEPVPSFAGFRRHELDGLIDHLLGEGWLDDADGALLLGRRAEATFGARNFFKLYAVFDTPPVFTVLAGADEIGTLQSWFATQLTGFRRTFQLAGRSWEATDVDAKHGVVRARPAATGKIPAWTGHPAPYSRAVCERILELLLADRIPRGADETAKLWVAHAREQFEGVALEANVRPVVAQNDRTVWYTFAGLRINTILGRLIEAMGDLDVTSSNIAVKLPSPEPSVLLEVGIQLLEALNDEELPRGESWSRFDTACRTNTLSTFQDCLPPAAQQESLRHVLMDVEGARSWARDIEIAG